MASNITLARPYAKAAFNAAKEHKSIDSWEKFLSTISLIVQNKDFVIVMTSPRVGAQKSAALLLEIYQKQTKDKEANKEFANFIKLLGQNGRLALLPEIANLFVQYRIEEENKLIINITSAFPITSEQQKKFGQALKIRMQREVDIEVNIDQDLIGGAVIRAGDFVIDGSVKTQVENMTRELIEM
jgi:F-type H+-transporting ATPase subunit delta